MFFSLADLVIGNLAIKTHVNNQFCEMSCSNVYMGTCSNHNIQCRPSITLIDDHSIHMWVYPMKY